MSGRSSVQISSLLRARRRRGRILALSAGGGLTARADLEVLPGGSPMICRSLPFPRLTSLFVGLTFVVFLASTSTTAYAQQSRNNHLANRLTKRVVGDYVYWSKYNNPPYGAAQIPYHKLTHINHGGVSFDASGALTVPDGFIEPELNNSAHAAGVKVLLLLGGDFTGLEASGAMQTLVDNVAAFEQQYAYDGADIDWEYPASSGDRAFLVNLMASLRASKPSYVLSIDIAPWGGYGYDVRLLQLSLDYFNIMMYDCAGPWTAHGQLNSAIFWDPHDTAGYECMPGGSVELTADYFLKQVPGAQLNMGTPFYGYHYANIHQVFGLCP